MHIYDLRHFVRKNDITYHKCIESVLKLTMHSLNRILIRIKTTEMSFSKKVREKIFSKYNGHCAYCGNKLGEIKEM